MESWSFLSDEMGLASSSAVESPSNSISRSAFMNCPTSSTTFRRRLSVSGQQPLDMVQTFGELGVPQRRPPFDSDQIVESNSRDSSSLVDLKLGRFGDAMNPGPLQEQRSVSSSESSKRVRPSTMNNTQTAYCQVYGCNKDLSSSKSYHKRHRVCDLHSKTATVIVKGIQQRFCQQCSRFHLIAEFDEGKRSCRKRLAGHNERRRKPLPPARSEGLLHSYIGNGLRGNTFMPASFICPDIQPSSRRDFLNLKRYATADAYKQVKIEYRTSTNNYGPLSPILIPIDQIHSETRTPVSGYTLFDKHLPFYQDSSSSSLGGEDYFPVSTTTIHGQLGTSEHGRALSLLSSRSQNLNSSTQTSGFSMAETLLGMAEPEPISSSSAEDQNYDQTGADDLMKFEVFEALVNRKEDRATTISLSQLSSRLQRVETQRQSLQS